jgi:hypothetical protein
MYRVSEYNTNVRLHDPLRSSAILGALSTLPIYRFPKCGAAQLAREKLTLARSTLSMLPLWSSFLLVLACSDNRDGLDDLFATRRADISTTERLALATFSVNDPRFC